MKYLTLFTSIALASTAAFFSIVGLASIFSGAFLSVVIMAGTLEFAKLVSASWLHYEWNRVNILIKMYFTFAILILMFITSLGIFGYLSRAHIETTIAIGGTNSLKIETLERRVSNERRRINDSETVLSQLDSSVQTLIDYDRVRGKDGAIAVRESQKEERGSLNETITESFENIESYQTELLPLQKEQLNLEVEVGPLKYVAEIIYGDEASNYYDNAVRWIIFIIILVFDPLAVLLLVVSVGSFKRDRARPSKPLIDETQIMVMK